VHHTRRSSPASAPDSRSVAGSYNFPLLAQIVALAATWRDGDGTKVF